MYGDTSPRRPAISPSSIEMEAQTVSYQPIDAVPIRLLTVVIICSSTHQYNGGCTLSMQHQSEAKKPTVGDVTGH